MAITIREPRAIDDQALLELSQLNPGYQFERDSQGRLVVSPPTGAQSGRRSAGILSQLHEWARKNHSGPVFDSSTGFSLPDGSLRCPDASWVRSEQWHKLTPEQREEFPRLCPDAVFEVRSRSDDVSELRLKMQSYIENGARLAVFVDPYDKKVEVYRPGRSAEEARYDKVALEPELPGFELDLTALDSD
jgi:Uma2 family endonuclease